MISPNTVKYRCLFVLAFILLVPINSFSQSSTESHCIMSLSPGTEVNDHPGIIGLFDRWIWETPFFQLRSKYCPVYIYWRSEFKLKQRKTDRKYLPFDNTTTGFK